jgi:hypothetical protein
MPRRQQATHLLGFGLHELKEKGYMTSRMHKAMSKLGYSFRDLGFVTDLDPGYLCRVANGKRHLSKPAAMKVARALKVSPRRLDATDRLGGAADG